MLRSLVGSEMCIRDRYQRRVRESDNSSMTRRRGSFFSSFSFFDDSDSEGDCSATCGIVLGCIFGSIILGIVIWICVKKGCCRRKYKPDSQVAMANMPASKPTYPAYAIDATSGASHVPPPPANACTSSSLPPVYADAAAPPVYSDPAKTPAQA
eukprot:TRINITY_DN12577_c0_g1_i9.p1 TRINITY_DN12577_c0_g1~~TRINITY_DN12577_c0_g1_i9.p1  ORF type:complete len:154 (-),score=38.48 TRINITY_DN12577_c0_g1_i9:255-716(-)